MAPPERKKRLIKSHNITKEINPYREVNNHSKKINNAENGRKTFIDKNRYHSNGDFSSRQRKQRIPNRRKVSLQYKNRKNVFLRTKSHSLDAIVEELYLSGAEDTNSGEEEFHFEASKPFIPRIKLKRSVSSLKEERRYQSLYEMSSQSEFMSMADSTNSLKNICEEVDGVDYGRLNQPAIYVNDQLQEIPKKPDENYFTKNFDECMKRLQLIEKEHELIEKDDTDVDLYFIQKKSGNEEMKTSDDNRTPSPEEVYDFKNSATDRDKTDSENHRYRPSHEGEYFTKMVTEGVQTGDSPTKVDGDAAKEAITMWYNNLKQQFERNEQDNQDLKNKEMSCRITGATLKNVNDVQNPDEKEKATRHYFSRLVKTNKSLIDEELPDPDKVKHIRAMFQENLNSTLKRNLGGSLQNINARPAESFVTRPLSAQCNRNDSSTEMGESQKEENKMSTGDDLTKDGHKDFQIENMKRKLFEKCDKDLKIGRDYRSRKLLQPKWTDTGSVSSGVSSDLSSFDTDLDSYSREEKEPDELTISDDDLLEEVKDKHYVQNEILEKIRYFGTSVTYYGGEMITCSVGPLLSPTAQAIMEEIGEKYGNEKNITRSFDEFYKKYVETNDTLSRKKKVGRTRSFGQNDVFQKPNVLSNTEIDMYKNDLELEIGIKKPTGIPLNGLKMKITKSASLGSHMEKAEEKIPTAAIDSQPTTTPSEEKTLSKEVSQEENELIPNTENPGTILERNSNSETTEVVDDHNETSIKEHKVEETPKEVLYARSKSAPEGFHCDKTPEDPTPEPYVLPSNQILFGYEKSLFNGKRKSDMEFEEFEVCETLSEKLDKLEEMNPSQNSTETKENTETNQRFAKEKEDDVSVAAESQSIATSEDSKDEKGSLKMSEATSEGSEKVDRKHSKYNHSRWPIETSVMVDIQKNNEQTPKVVTNGKASAKTKIRLF